MFAFYLSTNTMRRVFDGTGVISATLAPATSVLSSGDALQDTTNWAAFLNTSNYATSAGGETIDTVVVDYIGSTANATDTLWGDDTNHFSIIVTDTAGNERTFTTAARTVFNDDMVMTFETTTPSETIMVRFRNSGTYNATILWPDDTTSTITAFDDADREFTVATAGTYEVRVRGTAGGLNYGGDATQAAKVRTVDNLGDLGWVDFRNSFDGCTGMTSFTAGNTDTSAVTDFGQMFRNCSALTTVSIPTNWVQAAATNIARMFTNCSALTTAIDTSGWNTSNVTGADEIFNGASVMPFTNLDPSGWDLGNLNGSSGTPPEDGPYNSLFNLIPDTAAIPTANYDAFLIAQAADVLSLDANQFFGFGDTVYTTGGAAETARTALINAGHYIEDIGNAAPEQMDAASLAVQDTTKIRVTFASDPFTNGLPILTRDVRYREVGAPTWVEVTDVTSPWDSPSLTNGNYEVQTRANNFNGNGTWSTSATLEITGAVVISAENDGDEAILTVPSGSTDPLTVTVDGVDYTQSVPSSLSGVAQTLTVALIEANSQPVTNPTPAGSTGLGDTLDAADPIFIYAGEDPGLPTYQWQSDGVDISGATSKSFTITASEQGTDVRRIVTYDGVTVTSAVLSIPAGDVTAPILSNPTGAEDGQTGATSLGVTTDEANGTLFWGIYPAASTPSAADVVAGTGATVSGSQLVSSTGVQAVTDQTGLTASTGYRAHYVHDDTSSNRSNVATSATFTTDSSGPVTTARDVATGRIANFKIAGVTADGSNNVTEWAETYGATDYDLLPISSGADAPTLSAGSVVLDNSVTPQTLRSGVDITNPAKTVVQDQSKGLTMMVVAETLDGDTCRAMLTFCSLASTSIADAIAMGYYGNQPDGTDISIFASGKNAAAAVAFGSTSPESTTNVVPVGLMLLELEITPTTWNFRIDGVLEATGAVTSANLPDSTNARLTLGGVATDTSVQRHGDALVKEIDIRTSDANISAIRSEIMTEYGL